MSAPRVLVLRSSRFVDQALAFARTEWPGALIRVVHQPGSEGELDAAGIVEEDRIRMGPGDRITPSTLLCSKWGRSARRWRPDHVVVQWWNPEGIGHAAVNRAALVLQPRGFSAVLEAHSPRWVTASGIVSRWLRRAGLRIAGAGIVIAIAAATPMLWPATAWRRHAQRRRLAAIQ